MTDNAVRASGTDQSSRLDRAAEWFYERAGTRAVEWAMLIFAIWALGIVVPAFTSMHFLVLDATPGQVLTALMIFEPIYAAAIAVVVAMFMVDATPLRRWVGGDLSEESAVAAHAWIISGMPKNLGKGTAFLAAVTIVPAGYVASQLYGLGPMGTAAFEVACLVALVGSGIFLFLVYEQTLRTVLRDISRYWDTSSVAVRGVSLRAKVMWFVPNAVLFAATLSASTRTGRFGREAELAIWIGTALVATATFGWVMAVLLRSSVLERAELLGRALGRVAEGDLSQRLIASYGDELDEIVHEFNEMTEQLSAHDSELRASRARIVAAADESRRQVERDLHDGAQQYLVLMELKLGLLARGVAEHPKNAALAAELKSDLGNAMAELRDLAHGLYPAVLETEGLAAALRAAGGRSPLPVSIDSDGLGRAAPDVEAAVYFCCLEAMQNAAKHAGEGASIAVKLGGVDGRLRFTVADNGSGYDTEALGTSHGLQNMVDRIGALGGELTIESTLGEGTRVSGSVPMESP